MPLYTYVCTKCEHVFEKLVTKFEQAENCPECGKSCKRQLGTPMFKFKGGGWSDTGYTKVPGMDNSEETSSVTIRRPIIHDKNSGAFLGHGAAEVMKTKD